MFLFAFMFIDVLIYSLSLLVITWEFGCIYLLLAYMSVFLCAFKFMDVLIYSSSLLVITWEFGSLCLRLLNFSPYKGLTLGSWSSG